MKTRLWLLLSGLVLAFAGAPAAFAQSPVGRVYGGQAGALEEGIGAEGTAAGSLPFTGLDLAFLVVAAALLLVTGVTVRRLARAQI